MSLDRELAKLDSIVGAVNVPFSTKSVGEDGTTLRLRGVAASSALDRAREQFDGPTLRKAFEQYIRTAPTVVLEHDQSLVLGRIVDAHYGANGKIEVEAEIPKPAPTAPSVLRKAYDAVRSGALQAFSVGGRWLKVPQAAGGAKLFATHVVEVSVAALGYNPEATFELAGTKALSGASLDVALAELDGLTSGSLDDALDLLAAL